MKRMNPISRGSGDFEARLWAKLQEQNEFGYQWRYKAHFKSFRPDFVEHDALLIVEQKEMGSK